MEKRLLLFFAIAFLIITQWPRLFPPPEPPPVSATDVESGANPGVASGVGAETGSESSASRGGDESNVAPSASAEANEPSEGAAAAVGPAHMAEREEPVVVETDRYRLELSNRGGRLVSATLRDYLDDAGKPYELVDHRAAEHVGTYPLDLVLESASRTEELRSALFVIEKEGNASISGKETSALTLSFADGKGLEVTKRLQFLGDAYGFGVTVSVRERGQEIGKQVVFGPGLGAEVAASRYVGVEKGVLVSRKEVQLFAAKDLEEGASGIDIEATGVASHYFAALLIPKGTGLYGARLYRVSIPAEVPEANPSDSKKPPETKKQQDVIVAGLDAPREPASFQLFLGPKKLELLESLRPGLSRIIEFGSWMRYPALLLRAGLMWLYTVVGNYGWAVILLTLVINLALLPLKHYSFVSMRKMQKLAPQIQRIKERYKKVKPTDPRYQHMNQEIMNIYKEHNVSPVSGCLPMVLMIPFFFAFYRLLMASIELRQAPFVFWIHDLSKYDPYFVLPILMGITQLAIQRMTPQTTADPVQAKIMQFMPVMFTFILAWAPSGLVLYWFSNNLVSVGQQVVTNRLLERQEDDDSDAGKKRKSKK
jgi:YidC/Oxa1 family membrane protein insertase